MKRDWHFGPALLKSQSLWLTSKCYPCQILQLATLNWAPEHQIRITIILLLGWILPSAPTTLFFVLRDNFSRLELMYLIKLRYSTFILTESWVYISTFLHSAVWQQIIHYSEKTRQDNELPDPDSGLCNFHENTSPSLNVSLSHCTNILYSLEFYTSSQPTMSTSTRTKNRTISF